MKLIVSELPCSQYECPFSKAYTIPLFDINTTREFDLPLYECTIAKGPCDLGCSEYTCSGLQVITSGRYMSGDIYKLLCKN